VLVLTPLQNFVKVEQAIIERSTIHRKIIHEDFHYLFNIISKYGIHASLKSSRGIKPNGIILQAKVPNGQVKVVFSWSSLCMGIYENPK
jgi:hypothetical protein